MAPPTSQRNSSSSSSSSRNKKTTSSSSSSSSSSSARLLSSSSSARLLAEAEKVKKQAERKDEGLARGSLFAECTQLLLQILSIPSSPQHEEALFDLGEVYALWASSVQAGVYEMVGSIFDGRINKTDAWNIQMDAGQRSSNLYRKSFDMYEKVASVESSEFKQEALINSASSLCDWAEVTLELPAEKGGGIAAALDLLKQADARYSIALSVTPSDIELLVNYGDCNIKRAEVEMQRSNESSESQAWRVAKDFYSKGLQMYERAWNLGNTSVGDDMAGLLQNWGAGLASFAERNPDSSSESMTAFEQALEKLRGAAKIHPTDVSIFIAIGEACCALAEKVPPLQALELLNIALEEGFGIALCVNSTCLDAIIGKAEAHFVAGKSSQNIGKFTDAEEHLVHSMSTYTKAVEILKAGNCKLKFEEQCGVVFNLACVAALLNQEAYALEALTLLVNVGGISLSDLTGDPDLQNFRTQQWFVSLFQKCIH